LSQTSEQVVEEGLRALSKRKKPTVISGWKNRLICFATRILSRKMTAQLMNR